MTAHLNAERLQKMLAYLDGMESQGYGGMVMANFFAHWKDDIRQLANSALSTPARESQPEQIPDTVDARRYRRLRLLGCAPGETTHLSRGLVMRFSNLDEFVDADIATHNSRGESIPARELGKQDD